MKKVVFVIALALIAVTSSINVQANALPITNNSKEVVSDNEPLWWSCEKWAADQATNDGWTFDSTKWYHAKHVHQVWCMENVKPAPDDNSNGNH